MVQTVALPLTGQGDSTAAVATERIAGAEFQYVKLCDGTITETRAFIGATTTPGSSDLGLVVRNIPGGLQPVSQGSAWVVDQGAPWVIVGSVALDPSTEKIGTVGQGTPGSSATPWFFAGTVAVSSGSISLSSGLLTIGTVAQGSAGSSNSPWFMTGSVAVSSGSVGISSGNVVAAQGTAASSSAPWQVTGSVLISSSTATIGTVINATSTSQIGAVALSSGTQTVGSVVQGSAGSSTQPWYFVGASAGSSANMLGTVVLSSGTTGITLGAVALLAGSSANMAGAFAQGPGASESSWVVNGYTFSSAQTSRTTANTTVDAAVIAAVANRKAMVIQNLTTVDLALGFSTAALTTALANISYILASRQSLTFGGMAGMVPNYTGPVRGLIIGSSVVSGGVSVTQFLNT